MNFLTIEKFHSRSRVSIYRKVMLGLIMLVVPTVFVTAWVFYSFNDVELIRESKAGARQFDDGEITMVTRNK